MSVNRKSLDELGTMHGTDKVSKRHGYLQGYEQFFESMRNIPVSIFEIGVKEGASVRMWKDYFAEAHIVGMDRNSNAHVHAAERISIEIGDQADRQALLGVCERHGPFDIIVDDGSHIWIHQISCLETLFPHVKPGGCYVIEDIHTSFAGSAHAYHGGLAFSAFDYIQRLSQIVTESDRAQIRSSARSTDKLAMMTSFVCLIRRARFCGGEARRARRNRDAMLSRHIDLLDPGGVSAAFEWRSEEGKEGISRDFDAHGPRAEAGDVGVIVRAGEARLRARVQNRRTHTNEAVSSYRHADARAAHQNTERGASGRDAVGHHTRKIRVVHGVRAVGTMVLDDVALGGESLLEENLEGKARVIGCNRDMEHCRHLLACQRRRTKSIDGRRGIQARRFRSTAISR